MVSTVIRIVKVGGDPDGQLIVEIPINFTVFGEKKG